MESCTIDHNSTCSNKNQRNRIQSRSKGIEEVTHVFADGLNLGVVVGLPSALPAEPYATCEEAGPKSALEAPSIFFKVFQESCTKNVGVQ